MHFDNTYNSKTATDNIYKVITKLNVDLETYVANTKEFDDILLAFLKASAADFEAQLILDLLQFYTKLLLNMESNIFLMSFISY